MSVGCVNKIEFYTINSTKNIDVLFFIFPAGLSLVKLCLICMCYQKGQVSDKYWPHSCIGHCIN